MTFSLVARDPENGSFGMILSSSSPAVASRCVNLAVGTGAVASQNVTSPALGAAILAFLADGEDAESALANALADERFPDYRQATVVDGHGRTAVHSGVRSLGINAHAQGDAAVAAGNMLANPQVPQRMLDAYAKSRAAAFEQRLTDGLIAALACGGELGPVRSAGLAVVDGAAWRTTDLRVDDHADPIGELARLVTLWLPQKESYLLRAIDPSAAPSYGVPGDE